MIIYLIQNTVNGKLYVGQTIESLATRWRKHKSHARRGSLSRIAKAIRKYGESAFTVESIVMAKTIADLNNLERLWISIFQTTDGNNGYNVTAGGDARCVTPEGIAKMRASLTGKKRPPEVCKKIAEATRTRWKDSLYRQRVSLAISKSLTGSKRTEESKKKQSQSRIGLKLSASTREKMSAAQRMRWIHKRAPNGE